MSTTNLARFNGIDSTSGETSFVIRINNCPAGFNRIRYELHPAQRPVSGMPGTLQPAPGATASGIGVKVADEGGRAVPFEISLPLTDYDRSTGGSYAIPRSRFAASAQGQSAGDLACPSDSAVRWPTASAATERPSPSLPGSVGASSLASCLQFPLPRSRSASSSSWVRSVSCLLNVLGYVCDDRRAE